MLKYLPILGCILFSNQLWAQDVPMINVDPKVDRPLEPAMFDFITTTLNGHLASYMECTLKTKFNREVRNFSTGPEWVETLAVDFHSGGVFCPSMSFKFPMTSKYGIQKASNQWSGIGEEIKLEAGDYYGHWLKFTHDGKGRIVELMLGNDLQVCPCHLKLNP